MISTQLTAISTKFNANDSRVVVRGNELTYVAHALLSSLSKNRLLEALDAVLQRGCLHLEEAGFWYLTDEDLSDLDDEEVPPFCVRMRVVTEVAYIPEPDFARLMLRVAQTFISGATDCDHPMLREPWWPELLDAAARLEAQVKALDDDEAAA